MNDLCFPHSRYTPAAAHAKPAAAEPTVSTGPVVMIPTDPVIYRLLPPPADLPPLSNPWIASTATKVPNRGQTTPAKVLPQGMATEVPAVVLPPLLLDIVNGLADQPADSDYPPPSK